MMDSRNRNPYNWGGSTYPEYSGEMKSKKGESERIASERAVTERSQREFNELHKQQELAAQKAESAKRGDTISQFEGSDVTQTPFYKRTLALGIDDTSKAFNDVRSQRTARARMAGFGNDQPIKQADDTGVDSMEATELGRLPMEAAQETSALALDAANQRGQIAAGEGQIASQFGQSSEMYNDSSNSNQQLQAKLETARQERRAKMWKRLAGVGMLAAAPFTGGATAAALVTGGGSSISNS